MGNKKSISLHASGNYSSTLKKWGYTGFALSFHLSFRPSFRPTSSDKFFVTLFSRTVRATKMKLGTHIPSGLMYCVYQNQGQGPITLGVASLNRFYNVPLMKNFCFRILRNYDSCKVQTWYTHGQWATVYCIPESGPITLGVTSLDRFYNLPLMKKFGHTFLKNCEGYKVETWYTHAQWVDV